MKFFIKLFFIFAAFIIITQPSNAEEKKDCAEFKKFSQEYFSCTAKKIAKGLKNFKIDGKSPTEVKEEIKNLKY